MRDRRDRERETYQLPEHGRCEKAVVIFSPRKQAEERGRKGEENRSKSPSVIKKITQDGCVERRVAIQGRVVEVLLTGSASLPRLGLQSSHAINL
jgi:hypothetical protein